MVVVMVVAVEEEGASTIETVVKPEVVKVVKPATIETVVKPEVVKVVKPAAEATVAKLEITTLVKTEAAVKTEASSAVAETTAPACPLC